MGRRKKNVTMFAEPVIKTTRSLVYKYRCSACGNTIGIEDQQAVARLALGQSLPVRGCASPGCTLGADGGPYSISESSLSTASRRDPRVEQMIQEFKSRIRMAAVQSLINDGAETGEQLNERMAQVMERTEFPRAEGPNKDE